MSGMEAARIKKAYLKLLLAFEQHISQDATVELRKVKPACCWGIMVQDVHPETLLIA